MLVNKPNEIIKIARHEILIKSSYDDAIKLLLESSEIFAQELEYFQNLFKLTLALAYQEKKEYSAASRLYKEAGENYQSGFCELLLGNRQEAERLWNSCQKSPAVEWGKCLLDYIILKPNPRPPSYLQIRNFLETDIGYFIQAKKFNYAENIIKNESLFISVNLESYKLIGRVLLNYGFLSMAKPFLIKSMKIIDEDSETFFHLGQYYYEIGDHKESLVMLKRCLELNRYYVPATNLIKKNHLKLTSA